MRVFLFQRASAFTLPWLAMSNACMSKLCSIHPNATSPLPPRRRNVIQLFKSFSCCSSLFLSSASSPFTVRPSSIPLVYAVAQPTPSTPSGTTQRSEEWFALRKDKLTTSTFSTALGFWKGTRRAELWLEKVFMPDDQSVEVPKMRAMEWGVINEAAAIKRYKSIMGHDVSSLGFAVHPEERLGYLGASPDGLLGCSSNGGILEVKCPYNKGKPELGLPWSNVPFYYMPQVQGQMEIMGRDWVDLYCWTPNGSTVFRICRDRGYWELIHGILHEFWWGNVVPAREAMLLGMEEEARSYKPASTHKQTGRVIAGSLKLAGQAKLLCREIADHVEFYR